MANDQAREPVDGGDSARETAHEEATTSLPGEDLPTRNQKAFDFAQEATKQLITLATGVLAVTITFLTDVLDNQKTALGWLEAAWIAYLVSVVAGVATLQCLSGNLERPGGGSAPSIYSPAIRTFSIAQALSFLTAVSLTVVFGFQAL